MRASAVRVQAAAGHERPRHDLAFAGSQAGRRLAHRDRRSTGRSGRISPPRARTSSAIAGRPRRSRRSRCWANGARGRRRTCGSSSRTPSAPSSADLARRSPRTCGDQLASAELVRIRRWRRSPCRRSYGDPVLVGRTLQLASRPRTPSAGLQRARCVVDPGVDHAAVVPGLVRRRRRTPSRGREPEAGRGSRIRRAVARPTIPPPTTTIVVDGGVRGHGSSARRSRAAAPPRRRRLRGRPQACAHGRRAPAALPGPPTSRAPSVGTTRAPRRSTNRELPREIARTAASSPIARMASAAHAIALAAGASPPGRTRPPMRIVYSCVTTAA